MSPNPPKGSARRDQPPKSTASFVVVANRLPVDRVENPDGSVEWRTSPGGLVTAFDPVMRARHGAWVGWQGAPDQAMEPFAHNGLELVPVPVSASEIEEYYEGFSNATLWPLYHDVVVAPVYHREWWDAYVAVNQRFADAAADVAEQRAVVWVQDYQLQLVPQMLREQRPDLRIGFFLHIPFPPTELYQQLPWRNQILEGLLGADLVGFQLPGGAQNFVRLVRQRLGLETRRDHIRMSDGRSVLARAYPISIDGQGLHELAMAEETKARGKQIRRDLGDPKYLFLGVDRLDYTKGLPERIRAFGELISEGSIDADEAVFVQVATPSRERVDQYRILRDDIDRLVGRINGDIGRLGRPPITYLHSSYPREEMAALYGEADIMVVTPLRDGMNLVAKEFVACRAGDTGALVLSEFTGAAKELRQAYLVNPHDINGLKDALLWAMHDTERNKARRMRVMRRQVFDHDIDRWAEEFLDDLGGVGEDPFVTLRLGSVVINCANLDVMTAFWSEALDLEVGPVSPAGTFRVLAGDIVQLSLQVAEERVTARDQMHLDLYTREQSAEVSRLLALGATLVRHHDDPDDDYVVMADPEGNQYCVIALPAA